MLTHPPSSRDPRRRQACGLTFPRNIDKIRIPREFPQGMIPLQQRAASAEEVANAILFLASDEASYITGTEMYVDGALSLFQG